ncbi:MAG: hypothetical protein EAZ97_10955 [Bacteroidetes bacterium]|nr:MAG: hypothetical protein EAZ97_10955 [Bacteroidota bacterium]
MTQGKAIFKSVKLLTVLSFVLFLATSCSKSSKDLEVKKSGLVAGDIYLEVDGKRLDKNEVLFGSNVFLFVAGLNNLEQKDGKVFIGCSMVVSDSTGKILAESEDVFAQYKDSGISPQDAANLNINMDTGDPMVAGSTYNWKARFFDRLNPKNEIKTETDVKLLKGTALSFQLQTNNQGLTIGKAGIVKDAKPMLYEEMPYGKKISMFLGNLQGFQQDASGKVFPGCAMVVTDLQGNVVLAYDDLFKNADQTGVNLVDVKDMQIQLTVGEPIKKGQKYNWIASVWDKKTGGQIRSEVIINVQ